MTQTALAFGIKKPSTLDEALTVIERLSGANATILASRVDHQRGPGEGRVWNETIDNLIRARKSIKAGRSDDALYEIEKALSWMDSGWSCRSS